MSEAKPNAAPESILGVPADEIKEIKQTAAAEPRVPGVTTPIATAGESPDKKPKVPVSPIAQKKKLTLATVIARTRGIGTIEAEAIAQEFITKEHEVIQAYTAGDIAKINELLTPAKPEPENK